MAFGRRSSRARSREPLDHSTSSSAAAAASLAFHIQAESKASLSSAAAATALRSLNTTPEPVGSIQTKRMVRRGSWSSVESGSVAGSGTRGGVARAGLQRRNSAGSMTERTFRSPSPGRTPNRAVSPADDVPPVPALPRNIPNAVEQKRASSLEPPARVTSPTPRRGGRGVSVGEVSWQPPPKTSRQAKRLSNVTEVEELYRQQSNSVNFSRPMSGYTPSPAKRYTHGTGSWFSGAAGAVTSADGSRPKTSDGVTRKKTAPNGTSHQGPAQVAYDAVDSIMVYDPNTRTFVTKPRDKPKEPEPEPELKPEPPPPIVAKTGGKPLAPGSYNPHTRSFVPGSVAQGTVSSGSGLPSGGETAPAQQKTQKPVLPSVQTKLEPPPRNPARISSAGNAIPMSPRASGLLYHQPSVVREDPEGEERATVADPSASTSEKIIQTSMGPAKAYVALPAPASPQHQRSTSLDIPRQSEGAGRGRNGSMSPQRNAHFSASPVIQALKHNPLPRSVSPAKSALKQPSASSLRASSPLLTTTAPRAPSSEAGSEVSDDSAPSSSTKKKKKGVRVSFDEQPQEIDEAGAAATPIALANATLSPMSPTRSRSPAIDPDDLEAELMKPRPALPSFGSVRKNRMPEVAEKVTEMPPDRQGEKEGVSSDLALGGILANANRERLPLPPEVTSKEPADDMSEESDEDVKPGLTSTPVRPGGVRRISVDEKDMKEEHWPKIKDFAHEPAILEPEAESGETQLSENIDVPAINLLPPTPGVDGEGKKLGEDVGVVEDGDEGVKEEEARARPRNSMDGFAVPGGWGREEEVSDDKIVAASIAPASKPEEYSPSKPAAATHEPAPMKLNTDAEQDVDHAPSPMLNAINEDSDDSAAFSDAAEDLSDLEDGGFTSLDAIANSPIAPLSAEKGMVPALLESPTRKQTAPNAGWKEEASGDWSQATAYWSQLSKQQREQIERDNALVDDEATTAPAPMRDWKNSRNVDGMVTPASTSKVPVAQIPSQRAPPVRQAATQQVPMKKSMRASQAGPGPAPADGEVSMRRSMRGSPSQQRPRPQSEYIEPRGALQKRSIPLQRPTSFDGAPVQRQRVDRASKTLPQTSAFPNFPAKVAAQQQSAPPPAKLAKAAVTSTTGPAAASSKSFMGKPQRKVGANEDSDSESSFKKKRRPSVSTVDTSGKYTMRQSMRGGSVDERSPLPTTDGGGKGSYSIRSLSPTGNFLGMKRETLRSSLRSESASAGPKRTTLRSGPPPAGKGNAFTSAATRPAAAQPKRNAFTSRFAADSDDEDEDGGPRRPLFKSRFVDSDDENEDDAPRGGLEADLTPVRGIPRRHGQEDGDSTELEDEEEEEDPRKASRKRDKAVKPIVPDSADVDKAMGAARRKLGIESLPWETTADGAREKKEGAALSKGSLRKPAPATAVAEKSEPKSRVEDLQQINSAPEKKRRGFMGGILRRNRNSSLSVQQVGSGTGSPAPASPGVGSVVSPQSSKQEEPASPSSPSLGQLVRRGSKQPVMTRGNSNYSGTTAALPPNIAAKESGPWPLSPESKVTANGVASPSSTIAGTERPDLAPRTQSGTESGSRVRIQGPEEEKEEEAEAEEAGVEAGEPDAKVVYSQRTGRKKKFMMLRRAFGLND